MQAIALVCDQKQRFTLEKVVVPDPLPNQIGVRTQCSGVSIGTEFAVIQGKLNWGPYPLSTGYMGTGTVESVGKDVKGFRAGDQVYYRVNARMTFPDGREINCARGVHCSYAVLDPSTNHGAEKVPDGVPMDVASMFVMPAVGLYGVDMANPRMGDTVVVYGAGLIGLGVAAACSHRGCRVVSVDIDDARLKIAAAMGADVTINSKRQDVAAEVEKLIAGGADVVFESTGLPHLLDPAIGLCRQYGTFVWQGNYGEEPVSLHFLVPHRKRLRMFFPCDDGLQPCRRAVLKNMATGALRWDKTITHRIGYTDAPAMYEKINRGVTSDILGVVIRWKEA
jgi:2-desacetyl-2-hydroxyethyl bacteriochlorophyllide A dehydrogenase